MKSEAPKPEATAIISVDSSIGEFLPTSHKPKAMLLRNKTRHVQNIRFKNCMVLLVVVQSVSGNCS
jgi:hypothetical protein